MPIEIRELVIKAQVTPEHTGNNSATGGNNANAATGQEQVVALCVEKVLEILKEKSER